jgi:peptidoglycan hydrolase-like protein with peptidoglycan-binding domain
MPVLNNVLGTTTAINDQTKALTSQLHDELTKLGVGVPNAERTASGFGAGTSQAVADFRKRFGLPNGNVVDPATGVVMTIASVAADGDHASLRAAIQQASYQSAPTNRRPPIGYGVTALVIKKRGSAALPPPTRYE